MHKGNALTALAIALLATAAGCYLSGYLTLRLLGLDPGLLAWHSYPDYIRALALPQVHPYGGRIKLAGWFGFGIPVLAGLALLVPVLRPARRSIHGDARFASARAWSVPRPIPNHRLSGVAPNSSGVTCGPLARRWRGSPPSSSILRTGTRVGPSGRWCIIFRTVTSMPTPG